MAGMGSAAKGSTPSASTGRAVMRVGVSPGGTTLKAGPGESVGSLKVAGIESQLASGLEAVSDPGYRLVFIALLLIALGTTVTFAQKLLEGV